MFHNNIDMPTQWVKIIKAKLYIFMEYIQLPFSNTLLKEPLKYVFISARYGHRSITKLMDSTNTSMIPCQSLLGFMVYPVLSHLTLRK